MATITFADYRMSAVVAALQGTGIEFDIATSGMQPQYGVVEQVISPETAEKIASLHSAVNQLDNLLFGNGFGSRGTTPAELVKAIESLSRLLSPNSRELTMLVDAANRLSTATRGY